MALCASVFEQKTICLESPGDHNSTTSRKGSSSDLTSWFYRGSIDRSVCSLAHGKWSTVLQGEKSMIPPPPSPTHTHTHRVLNTLLFFYNFYFTARRIKIKKLLDDINVVHKATAFRTSYLRELLFHICKIVWFHYDLFSFIVCLLFTQIYIIEFSLVLQCAEQTSSVLAWFYFLLMSPGMLSLWTEGTLQMWISTDLTC